MEIDKRLQIGVVILLLLAFAAGVKYGTCHQGNQESPAGEELLLSTAESGEKMAEEEQGKVSVYVCGAVEYPAVYELDCGSRVFEAVSRAVPLETADLRYLGMARELEDGETILVPEAGEMVESQTIPAAGSPGTPSTSYSIGGKVNINQAGAAEMAEELNGIGSVLSQRIVDYREANGPFQKIEDIKKVSGIGDKKYEDIKDHISIK